MHINGRSIGADHPPYLIAELSGNHNGDFDRAKALIAAAQSAGADAIKLQTYRADTLTLKSDLPDFQITQGLWKGRTLFDLYEWAHTPWEWMKPLFEYARERGITIFSSPFDESAIDLLEDLNAPAYKIASFELIDLPLIRYAAATGKPLILSTGMANAEEIADALEAAREGGCRDLALLHCVSGYPAPASEYDLRTLPDMQARFGVPVGLSDHTLDNATAIASVALGACIIEKHFTLNRRGGGPDDAFSLEPDEFSALCTSARTAHAALGSAHYNRRPSEEANLKFRRSLYFVRDVKAGETISTDAVRSVRPGYGLAPKHKDAIIGKKAARDCLACTPVTWESIL